MGSQFKGRPTVFSTRSPAEHNRKRKMLSPAFSMKSTLEFEPVVIKYNRLLMLHWDRICEEATQGRDGRVGDCTWSSKDGKAVFDCLP